LKKWIRDLLKEQESLSTREIYRLLEEASLDNPRTGGRYFYSTTIPRIAAICRHDPLITLANPNEYDGSSVPAKWRLKNHAGE